jgi:hypothetical protein
VPILKDWCLAGRECLILQDGSTGLRVPHALNELGDFFRPRFDLGRIIANEFVEIEELMLVVSGTSVPESRLLASDWSVTAGV